jgi:RNA polymerase sigma factor for flagellar operon FliA
VQLKQLQLFSEGFMYLDVQRGQYMTPAVIVSKASAADVEYRNELVSQELSQVRHIACRIRERLPRHSRLEDLVNSGVLGLLEASQSFDSSKNVQFRTFAKFRIRGAMLDSLRAADWGSRSLRRRGREIVDARARLESTLGRLPSNSEIAKELDLETGHLDKILCQLHGLQVAQQVSRPTDLTEGVDVIESAPDLRGPDPFDLCLQAEMSAHLTEALSKLTAREQLIISLYYGDELLMAGIAEILGLAASRVSQILKATISKLKISMAPSASRR